MPGCCDTLHPMGARRGWPVALLACAILALSPIAVTRAQAPPPPPTPQPIPQPPQEQRQTQPPGNPAAAEPQIVRGKPGIVEGDLLQFPDTRVRIAGIDAPDFNQRCVSSFGRIYRCDLVATRFLRNFIQDRTVECRLVGNDPTGQVIGRCFVDGRDVGASIVLAGWAFAYRTLDVEYREFETRAQARRRGLWSGRAEAPWVYRSRLIGLPEGTVPPPPAPTTPPRSPIGRP